jgi:hypothetical protein
MVGKTLIILEISREGGGRDEGGLAFTHGVNVLVGPPNAGKSKWLETVDYLLGDDVSAAERSEDDIFAKYESARATLQISGELVAVERRWKEQGAMNKVYVNGQAIALEDYRSLLMEKLSIPSVHYPQGNPYGPRTWPEIGWRSIMRHVYRRQKLWNDLADQQPQSEQHACLMQLLGVAQEIFSSDYGQLIAKSKRILELQGQRQQFMEMLQEVSREVISAKELGVAITPQSLDAAVSRLRGEKGRFEAEREQILEKLRNAAFADAQGKGEPDVVDALSEKLVGAQAEHEANFKALQRSEARRTEVEGYQRLLKDELSRMERALEAGNVLADLKVTHCPVCDQEVHRGADREGACYLCKEPLAQDSALQSAEGRLKFETDQLRGEIEETEKLVERLAEEIGRLQDERAHLAATSARLQQDLRPVRSAAAAILPPELAVIDMNVGRVQEQEQQLERVRAALKKREELAEQITDIQAEVSVLETTVSAHNSHVDYERLGDLIADGMNTYLGRIQELNPASWTQQEVSVQLSERDCRIKVGKSNWRTKLGGTLGLYFLLAYQYALMNLTKEPGTHYPGLVILDFPAEVNGVSIEDEENFVLVPFIELAGQKGMEQTQVVAAGSSFKNLVGAHRVELNTVWK